jgi:hypothetical protein
MIKENTFIAKHSILAMKFCIAKLFFLAEYFANLPLLIDFGTKPEDHISELY